MKTTESNTAIRRSGTTHASCLLLLLLLAAATVVVRADQEGDFGYTTNGNSVIITNYTGPVGDVVIPGTIKGMPVTAIGYAAFASRYGITSITLPESVTHIGDFAFQWCTELTIINIPANLASIGEWAFNTCIGLTSITLPNSVTNIGRGAFASCGGLGAITVSAPNSFYSSVAGVLFNADQTTLIQCPGGKTGDYTVPTGVTMVGEIAFLGCFYLGGVIIPNTVTNIGMSAFTDCFSLASVTLPDGLTRVPEFVFGYCKSLTRITIPNSVTSIGGFAFQHCDSLASVIVPRGVTFLEGYVFDYCHSLKSVYFLGNAPPEYYDFRGATNATVYYLPGNTGWGPIYDGRPAVLWNPQAQTGDGSFGVRTNRFGFNITGASNLVIVVEACTNVGNPVWSPVATNTLTGGSSYFSDPQWTNHPARFYRLRSP